MRLLPTATCHPLTQSVKFDDLCTNFGHHEDLDESEAVVTITVTPDGGIAGMSLEASGSAGVIPVTVPTTFVESVRGTRTPVGHHSVSSRVLTPREFRDRLGNIESSCDRLPLFPYGPKVDTTGLPSGQPYKQEAYGSDTTFYIATSSEDEPVAATKPSPE